MFRPAAPPGLAGRLGVRPGLPGPRRRGPPGRLLRLRRGRGLGDGGRRLLGLLRLLRGPGRHWPRPRPGDRPSPGPRRAGRRRPGHRRAARCRGRRRAVSELGRQGLLTAGRAGFPDFAGPSDPVPPLLDRGGTWGGVPAGGLRAGHGSTILPARGPAGCLWREARPLHLYGLGVRESLPARRARFTRIVVLAGVMIAPWLLDVVPPDFRLHGVLRRHPTALAAMARHHTQACVEGARAGYRSARTELGEALPPHAIDAVLAAYRAEGRRLAATAKAVILIEQAMRGDVFTPQLRDQS